MSFLFQTGVLLHHSKKYVIETLRKETTADPENNFEATRVKRDASDRNDLVLIYDPLDGDCGLKPQNKKRLLAPPWTDRIKVLDEIEPKDEPKFQRRRKRDLKPQKAIEIAVFVDDDLYKKTVEDGANNPEVEIQNLVFAYMNSVSVKGNFFQY